MAKKEKFTFKTEKPTGKWKAFEKTFHYISYNGECCGSITDGDWKIRLMIIKTDINEDGNPNCSWKWITLKKQPTSLEDAKIFLNENIELILKTYTFPTK